MKLLHAILVLLIGASCGVVYLRKPPLPASGADELHGVERPWRRLGAALIVVLSILYVVGIYGLDAPGHPWAFAAYWVVMLVLVVWLCGLALRDVVATRQWILRRYAARNDGEPSSVHGTERN